MTDVDHLRCVSTLACQVHSLVWPGVAEATGQKRFFPHLLKLNPSVTSLQTVFLGEESIDTFIPLSVK